MVNHIKIDLCVQSPCGLLDGSAPSGIIPPRLQSRQKPVLPPCRASVMVVKTDIGRKFACGDRCFDGRLVVSVCQHPEIMRLRQSPDGGPAEMRFGSARRIAGHCADEDFHEGDYCRNILAIATKEV